MFQVGRRLVVGGLLALSLSAFAGDTGANAKVNKAKPGASAGCTDLNGKPLPCPEPEKAPQPQQATRPRENRCTDLDGHPLPCPPEAATERSAKETASSDISLYALPRNLLSDQKAFWTSPARVREKDLPWLLPFTAFTAGVFASDTAIEGHLPTSQSVIDRSRHASDAGVAALLGVGGGLFLWGHASGNDQRREAGLLSGEAALGSLGVTELLKVTTRRQRPLEGNDKGDFFQGGDSFPSAHAAAAWSIATVLAHEYPTPVAQLFAYGLAGGVSAARITGRKHFASDVLIGSAIGWYMGRQVYRTHHGEGTASESIGAFYRDDGDSTRQPENMGSPYVPLDTWIYPAFDRLAALGYVQTGFAGLRPWTRMECARLLNEASDVSDVEDTSSEVRQLYDALADEFASEVALLRGGRNASAQVESVYTRFTGISGPPLTDGYHFGQTIINDYGRPYQAGANVVTGISARATAGPLVFYVRGEYQHAPSAPALPLAARENIALNDGLPVPPSTPIVATDRFRTLEAYLGLAIQNWQLTFGKQSLWWGPEQGGPMLFSNNAEPVAMLRLNRVSPFKLPSIFGLLGAIRTEFFLGQLAGTEFVYSPLGLVGRWGQSLNNQPIIHGQKFNFQPTPNFQFGIFRTTIYGGPGYPLTLHTLARSLLSTGNQVAGAPNKPGDRRSGVDLTYKIPKLRNWLTFYADGFTEDQYSPIAYADRSVWDAGIYIPRIPGINKLDLRAEGVYSDNPIGGNVGPGYFYANGTWRTGYRNDGNLIGSWIGRAGQGAQAWTTYHFDAKNSVQLNFRHQKVSWMFLPEGGTLTDVGARGEFWVRPTISISGFVQYEKWNFPVLGPAPQSNVTTSVQLTFWPRNLGRVNNTTHQSQ